jgi:hypothetical protein
LTEDDRYVLTVDGVRIAFYTKVYNRLLVPLTAAHQPQAPPELRAAPSAITRHADIHAQVTLARWLRRARGPVAGGSSLACRVRPRLTAALNPGFFVIKRGLNSATFHDHSGCSARRFSIILSSTQRCCFL